MGGMGINSGKMGPKEDQNPTRQTPSPPLPWLAYGESGLLQRTWVDLPL